jgi:hypothetical protein
LKNSFWVVLTAGVAVVSFLLGYNLSGHTGVEPGFFELPEAGGYGAGPGAGGASEGVTSDMEEYYKKLLE